MGLVTPAPRGRRGQKGVAAGGALAERAPVVLPACQELATFGLRGIEGAVLGFLLDRFWCPLGRDCPRIFQPAAAFLARYTHTKRWRRRNPVFCVAATTPGPQCPVWRPQCGPSPPSAPRQPQHPRAAMQGAPRAEAGGPPIARPGERWASPHNSPPCSSLTQRPQNATDSPRPSSPPARVAAAVSAPL